MLLESIPHWILKPALNLASKCPWANAKVNAYIINSAVDVCRHRPHPLSTVHDYVCWTSLTDQRYSARHLPPFYPMKPLPADTQVAALFARPAGQQRLSSKSTCLFPAFAQYLTDGFIRTRMPHTGESQDVRRQNTSNHQIDMCPLYGRNEAQTGQLRRLDETFGNRGRLKSQTINEEEYPPFLYDSTGAAKKEFDTLDPPLGISSLDTRPNGAQLKAAVFATGGDRVNSSPQIAMMNTLFLREHNRLAGKLEQQNPNWDDERVFQTARNIVIVLFIKLVVEEYINHILPLPFRLFTDPSMAWNAPWNKPNWITTEFSLLYRWHSLIPDAMRWGPTNYPAQNTILNNIVLFNNGLARSFLDLSEQPAGELGALNTAAALIPIELAAINQGRVCNVPPYAAYRQYVGLPVPAKFEDVSSNPQVVTMLKSLYATPGDIEFYPGLFAEDILDNSPLPALILKMVAVDAFSQALTNPLLSEHVFNPGTFTPFGWQTIADTKSLHDIVARNTTQDIGNRRVSLTQPGWKYQ